MNHITSESYGASKNDRYSLADAPRKGTPRVWRQENLLVDEAGTARMQAALIGAAIEKLKPKRVLDAGCGDGIYPLLFDIWRRLTVASRDFFRDPIGTCGPISLTPCGHRQILRKKCSSLLA